MRRARSRRRSGKSSHWRKARRSPAKSLSLAFEPLETRWLLSTTALVSQAKLGVAGVIDGTVQHMQVASDGAFTVFESSSSVLVAGVTSSAQQVIAQNTQTGGFSLVSAAPAGAPADAPASLLALSDDG